MSDVNYLTEVFRPDGKKAFLWANADKPNEDWTIKLKKRSLSGGVVTITVPDITGWTIKANLYGSVYEADPILSNLSCTVTDGPNGTFTIPFGSNALTEHRPRAFVKVWRETGGNKRIIFVMPTAIINPQ